MDATTPEPPPLPVEDVQRYPRPPALEPVPHDVRVVFAGVTVARTAAALRVLETHHAPTYYLPPDAWAEGALAAASGASFCEWKGRARYWDILAAGKRAGRAAWSYPSPTARFRPLAGYLAVYAGGVDACWVGGTRVIPQQGDFYGGWVTPNLTGIVKGGPGTAGW